jgi:prepilin-type N-terminal cleavage/methylation domain-containing protein
MNRSDSRKLRKTRHALRWSSQPHAFTLVELLVVIGVIAILAADLGLPHVPESRVLASSDMIAVSHAFPIPEAYDASVGFGWPGMVGNVSTGGSPHFGGDGAVFCDDHIETSRSETIPEDPEDPGFF